MRPLQRASFAAALAAGLFVFRTHGGGAISTITSPDGTWCAGIDASGQVVNLVPPGAAGDDNLFESLVYVANPQSGLLSERIEIFWQVTAQVFAPHQARTVLTRPGSNLELEIKVIMVDGPGGGEVVAITADNVGPTVTAAGLFLYFDLDIAGSSDNDEAAVILLPDSNQILAIQQFDGPDEAEPIRVGDFPGYASFEIDSFPDLRLRLDIGTGALSNFDWTNPGAFGDHTAALGEHLLLLPPGERTRIVARMGGIATGAACPWDCEPSPNGLVGTGDLLTLLGEWNLPGDCDLDGDGTGTADLLAMFAHWGVCPK